MPLELVRQQQGGQVRMPVDRAFTIKGTGTVVTGTVWSGRLTRDATVRVLPADRSVRVWDNGEAPTAKK